LSVSSEKEQEKLKISHQSQKSVQIFSSGNSRKVYGLWTLHRCLPYEYHCYERWSSLC
jgi:hypothetical protein